MKLPAPATRAPGAQRAGRDAQGAARTAQRAAQAAITYAAATMALGYPALAGQFLARPHSDQYIAGYAFREFAASALRAGEGMPLWNPYQFGGMPYVAAMHGDIFYPTALLRLVLPTDVAMTWGFLLHVFLAGLFTFLFLRVAGLGFAGALIGGLAYMMGGNVAGLVSPGHDGKLFVAALLPLALLFVHRGVRDGRAWAWGGLALTVTLATLSPHPQLLQYLLLATGAYAVFVALGHSGDEGLLPRRTALGRLGLVIGAIGIGMLGGAVQFASLPEYTSWSPRAGGRGWDHATQYSLPPEEMINFYLPQFSGILERYWGRNGIHLHSEYIGAAVLPLAGLGFAAPREWRRFVWFWTGTLVVATLWALGGFTPFYRLVYAVVPGTKFFRAPSTMLFVVAFSLAVLAAVGVERALRHPPRPRYVVSWLTGGVLVALFASSGVLTEAAATIAGPGRAELAYANASSVTAGAWRSLLAVALAAVALLLIRRGTLPLQAGVWTLATVVALDLWSVERLYWRFSPPAAELYRSDAAIEYLKRIPQPGRVVPLAFDPLEGTRRDPYMGNWEGRAAGLMVHGIRSVVGYHGNELGRYDVLTGWEIDWPRRIGNPNLRRLTNARYLYTDASEPPVEGARLVAGPATNAAGNTIYLYELPGDSPAAWVTPVAVKAPDESVLITLLDPRFDVRRAALFDTSAAVRTVPVPSALPAPIDVPVHVRRWAPGRISLLLDKPAPAGAALVVSENSYPGWSALVDGRPVSIGRADYVLIGLALPTGARQVELTYSSRWYGLGKAITLAVVALIALAVIAGIALERRRGTKDASMSKG